LPPRSAVRAAGLALLLISLVILGTGTSSASGLAAVRFNGPRTRPVVALTFDDGSSPANCRRILAELVADGVPATFFPIATAMAADVGFWRLVGEAGYPVGDHTLTHPEMPRLTLAQQEQQIGEGRVIAESILGRPLLRVFRPPYGAYDQATLVAAAATGFPIAMLWDVDTRDWARTHTLTQMLTAGEKGRDGSVILMHCGPNATPYLVPQLIDYYRGKGFGFVTIPQLLGIAWRPGATKPISPATILGNLSALPPLPSPSASPGSSPGPSPSDLASPTLSPEPSQVASEPVVSTPGAEPSLSGVSASPSPTIDGIDARVIVASVLLLAALVGVVLAGAVTGVVRRRRQ
jgi:peptidoglycan/xylan/chitin deacetylase (PgdA/CDA1 family)